MTTENVAGTIVADADADAAGALRGTTPAALRARVETNRFGVHRPMHAYPPAMRRRGHGRVVPIGSIAGRFGLPMRAFEVPTGPGTRRRGAARERLVSSVPLVSLAPETLFGYANALVLVGWAVLLVAPRGLRALDALPRLVLPCLLAFGYTALVLPSLLESDGSFDSIAGVRELFASDALLAAGWMHYLAFDLFVGAWIARASDEAGISRLAQAPLLVATFLVGPMGFLLFVLTRTALAAARPLEPRP